MGAMKSLYGDWQEANPLTESEEMALMEQQLIIEQLEYNEYGDH